MNGFGILMLILGVLLIPFGIYVYTGHDDLLAKGYYKKESKAYLRYLGKTIIFVGFSPIISGMTAFFVDENSILPLIVLFVLTIIILIISSKHYKK